MSLGNSSGKGQMESPLDFMCHTVCLNYSAIVAGKQPWTTCEELGVPTKLYLQQAAARFSTWAAGQPENRG